MLLRVDPEYGHVAGIDIGETGVKVELFDLAMTRAGRGRPAAALDAPGPGRGGGQAAEGLRQVIESAGVTESGVLGVGIGVPGTVEQGPGTLVHAQTIGWDAVPLPSMLRDPA